MTDIFIWWSQQLADNQNLREVYYRGLHDFEFLEGADLVGFAGAFQYCFRPSKNVQLLFATQNNTRFFIGASSDVPNLTNRMKVTGGGPDSGAVWV